MLLGCNNMRISENDIKILTLLQKNPSGLSATQMAKKLNKHLSFILLKLNRLERGLVVEKNDRAWPKIYKIKKDKKITHNDFIMIKCPKCGREMTMFGEQATKVCVECHHRFTIHSKEAVIDKEVIDKLKKIAFSKGKTVNELLKEVANKYTQ